MTQTHKKLVIQFMKLLQYQNKTLKIQTLAL